MAAELSLATGVAGQTVEAHVYFGSMRWDGGPGMADPATIADVDWDTNIISLSEELTSDATGTGLYVGDLPNTGETGIHHVVYFIGGAATLGRKHSAIQAVDNSVLSSVVWTAAKAAILADWTDGGRLDNLLDSVVPNFGDGARTVTITVDDGSDALENATVRVTKGATSIVGTTDASGEINGGSGFSLADGTWTVAISLTGYSFTPVSLVVSANTDVTYSMTGDSIGASDPGLVTGFLYCYNENGVVEEGAVVQIKFSDITGTGVSPDTKIRSATSSATGLVQFTNLFTGATYKIRRGADKPWKEVSIPADEVGTYALTDVWGVDE